MRGHLLCDFKLSYNEQREFEQSPVRIGNLEAEQERLSQATVHPRIL